MGKFTVILFLVPKRSVALSPCDLYLGDESRFNMGIAGVVVVSLVMFKRYAFSGCVVETALSVF